jgi:hypothetical protein
LIDHADLTDAVEVAWQASFAGRPDHAMLVSERALADKEYVIAAQMASCLGSAGQERQAIELLQLTIEQAEQSRTVPTEDVLAMRDRLTWELGAKIAGHGDPQRALEVARRVAVDSVELLGPTHPQTFRAQLTLARQLGAAGIHADALALALAVRTQATDVLGAEHYIVDSSRFEAAVWAGRVEGPEEAVRQFGDLLEELRARPSTDLSTTISYAWNLGAALLTAGDAHAALLVLEAVVNDARLTYDETYPKTLNYRLTYLEAIAATTGPAAAAELAEQLVDDSSRVLGDDHLTTLEARYGAARWTAEAGEDAAAARMFEEIHDDAVQVLGENHWLVEDLRTQLTRLPDA